MELVGDLCGEGLLAIPDEMLMSDFKEAGVHYADGDSDAESIRDHDAGRGSVQWFRRGG